MSKTRRQRMSFLVKDTSKLEASVKAKKNWKLASMSRVEKGIRVTMVREITPETQTRLMKELYKDSLE